MSEIFTKQPPAIVQLPWYNSFGFGGVVWPCDGHECPSYVAQSLRRLWFHGNNTPVPRCRTLPSFDAEHKI